MTHLEHELYSRSDVRALHELLYSGEIRIQVATSLLDIKPATDSSKKHAKTLDFLLFRVIDIAKQLLYTLVHNTFRKHLQLEKFTNELDKTETLSFGLLSSVVFVRV